MHVVVKRHVDGRILNIHRRFALMRVAMLNKKCVVLFIAATRVCYLVNACDNDNAYESSHDYFCFSLNFVF